MHNTKYSLEKQPFKNIRLSANAVNETAGDIACQFRKTCRKFVTFSIANDQGTYVEDIAQLAVRTRR